MTAKPPFNALRFAAPLVDVECRTSGGIILRSPQVLDAYPKHLGFHLRRWAAETPETIFLAEREEQGGWRHLSYRQALASVEAIGQALLDRDPSCQHPVILLSENSIDTALLTLAGMYIGIPIVPVSPAYSLMSQDFSKLRSIAELIAPSAVYAKDGARYARAIAAIAKPGIGIIVSEDGPPDLPHIYHTDLCRTVTTSAVARAFDNVDPDQVAKIMFTSGSTGEPKGVITTHRMLSVNQQSIAQIWPFLEDRPPVIVDWLPWSHAFGGNQNFNVILRNGGTLYIDDGRPMPDLIEKTVANLHEISPTLHFNTPRGYDMLLPYLEQNRQLSDHFCKNLDLIFYAGAALPQSLWERLEAIAIRSRGERVRIVSSWGSTETTNAVTSVHYAIEKTGVIGLPVPGVDLMLLPCAEGKMEMRVRGAIVTPGYWRRPDLTQAAFDEEGFYRIGDAGKLDDPCDPAKGVVFDGRIAEDFKLMSGTWVHAGQVRLGAVAACTPVIQDAVVTGHDKEEIGLLIFPNLAACRLVTGNADLSIEQAADDLQIRHHLQRGLQAYNRDNGTNSRRISRALVLSEPPSIDCGEITDKGYINQRAVRERRADLVNKLYAPRPEKDVLVLGALQSA